MEATRDPVPAWASDEPRPTTTQPQRTERMASQGQLNFLKGIRRYRDLSSLTEEQRAWLNGLTVVQLTEATTDLPMGRVRDALNVLEHLPQKPKHEQEAHELQEARDNPLFPEIPSGRYAVDSDEGELRFYRVWRGTRNPNYIKVYVQHGPDQSELFHKTALAIMEKILAVGPREAAIRYGHEIGACSNCGKRLTNRISRKLGIGPVCGGRLWEDFKDRVSEARAELLAQGLDPDELVDDA